MGFTADGAGDVREAADLGAPPAASAAVARRSRPGSCRIPRRAGRSSCFMAMPPAKTRSSERPAPSI